MIIAKDTVVSVTYELKLAQKNGEVVETVNDSNPLAFILGHGNLLPKFEDQLTGKKVGDSFDFVLKSVDAYGVISAEAIVELPKSVFAVEGEIDDNLLTIGHVIPMMDQGGNRFNGKVIELAAETVKMDFNHPLAGEDLHFKGEVVGVREATSEELTHGHIHASGGCGCGSGGCGSGCGDESCESEVSNSGGCGSGCGCN